MALGLPAGPPRTRASNSDREQAVALIRSHWSEGRITDEELERRVGLALQARTLGDLRELSADLPAPPLSRRERMRRAGGYLVRGLRTPGGVVAVVVGGILAFSVLGATAGQSDDEERVRVAPPPAAAPEETPPPPLLEERIVRGRPGQIHFDGDVAFQVRRVRTERSVAKRADRDGGRIVPGDNRQFIVATVRVVNRGAVPADPFCGSVGELRVAAGEAVEPIDGLYDLEGNQGICSGGLPRGEGATYKLVFQVPEGDVPRRLDLWNGDEPNDILGKTRIAIRV